MIEALPIQKRCRVVFLPEFFAKLPERTKWIDLNELV